MLSIIEISSNINLYCLCNRSSKETLYCDNLFRLVISDVVGEGRDLRWPGCRVEGRRVSQPVPRGPAQLAHPRDAALRDRPRADGRRPVDARLRPPGARWHIGGEPGGGVRRRRAPQRQHVHAEQSQQQRGQGALQTHHQQPLQVGSALILLLTVPTTAWTRRASDTSSTTTAGGERTHTAPYTRLTID